MLRPLTIVLALIGLNLVAVRYRRAPDPYDDRLETPIRSTADLLVKPDGSLEPRPVGGHFLVVKPDGFHGVKSFGGKLKSYADGTFVSYDERGVRVGYEYDRSRALGTIVYRPDGSIVGYEGKPGEMQAASHVIRPPLRSFNVVARRGQRIDHAAGPRYLVATADGSGHVRCDSWWHSPGIGGSFEQSAGSLQR